MRFTVPQFIEHEARIVGPLTFRQFIFIGTAGAIAFFLYYSLGKTNFFLFVLLTIILMTAGFILAFVKIGGRNLPVILANLFKFSVSPKMYIWKKKEQKVEALKKMEVKKEEAKDELPLKVAGKSHLKRLGVRVETNVR